MKDSYITAINTQRTTMDWIDMLVDNMSNMYTPGYRSTQGTFKTFLDGTNFDDTNVKTTQGKSLPGTASSNVFLEGDGFFVTKKPDGKELYTRLGEFTFDGEGTYRTKDKYAVQGYVLNDNGEIMSSPLTRNADVHTATPLNGGPGMMATTDIKLWIDPSNGKYLGKYDEYQIKEDGIIYGKADKGKTMVPLYKIALANFNNQNGLIKIKGLYYSESNESGKPVVGKGDIRSGLIEMSNVDLKADVAYFQQAKMQLDLTNKIISTNKQLLEQAIQLLQ